MYGCVNDGDYVMLQKLERTVKSGGTKYDVVVTFDRLTVEQVQNDAMSYYVWKIQRQIRDADETQRKKMAHDGIHVHATEAGKPYVSPQQMVAKMSPEQKKELLELLQNG